jgi:hypothetical protein
MNLKKRRVARQGERARREVLRNLRTEGEARKERTGAVWAAEAVDGSQEALLELGSPPHPGHRGPGVPPHEPAAPPAGSLRHGSLPRSLESSTKLLPAVARRRPW